MLIENFEGSDLGFGDYIRLKGLKVGSIIQLEGRKASKTCSGWALGVKRTLVVGNCTPFEVVSNTSDEGWDWHACNNWRVISISHLDIDHLYLATVGFPSDR